MLARIFDQFVIKVAGNQDRHKSSVRFWAESDHSFWSYLPLSDENFTHLNLNISEASWPILILCVASLGWGKGCLRFWGRLDQNFGFHGNRKPPLTYNGENDVSTFSRLFLIQSFLYLQVMWTWHKISDKFEFQPDRTTDYRVSCPWGLKIFPYTYNGKMVSPC